MANSNPMQAWRHAGGRSAVCLLWACLTWAALALGCEQRPSFVPGDECELNTQCAAQLVCRLGRCRVECRSARDCSVGLECVYDLDGLGACQLPNERECEVASNCPAPLVCRFARCTNECETDRDCPPGARCRESGDGSGCRDDADIECALNSDCAAPYICAVDGRCREQCRADRDCRDGLVCDDAMDPAVCVRATAPTDAGMDGSMDGSVADDAARPDSGRDGGVMTDGGVTPMVRPPLLATGFNHNCAAPTPTDVRCWGENIEGQLGIGAVTAGSATPVAASTSDVRILAAGADHTCAATSTDLFCWGRNMEGQLGLGSTTQQTSPQRVTGLGGPPLRLAAGRNHTCAQVGLSLFCWGANAEGQLGDGTTMNRDAPVDITARLAADPADVSAFGDHTCVVLIDGRVQCFGANGEGQLGDGTRVTRSTPTLVSGLTDAVEIAAGNTHSCARRATGAVVCWGSNVFGQLGIGMMTAGSTTPVATRAIPGAVAQISAGSVHVCARTASAVHCWGDNFAGQTGEVGGMGSTLAPRAVGGVGAVEEVAAGTSHTCVRVSGTMHRCWGSNMDGQLGDGTTGPGGATPVGVRWM